LAAADSETAADFEAAASCAAAAADDFQAAADFRLRLWLILCCGGSGCSWL